MKCPNCSSNVLPGADYCDSCGHAMAAPPAAAAAGGKTRRDNECSNCRTVNPAGALFCENCGSPLVSAPAAIRAANLRGKLVVQPGGVSLALPAQKAEIIIGREDPVSNNFPEIDLTLLGGVEGGVSRRHARLFLQNGELHVEDLNSVNHTFLNRQKVPPGQSARLNSGDELRLGRLVLVYYSN